LHDAGLHHVDKLMFYRLITVDGETIPPRTEQGPKCHVQFLMPNGSWLQWPETFARPIVAHGFACVRCGAKEWSDYVIHSGVSD
jgi:hypothetical protein